MDKLYFANGVALSQDGSLVLVCETWEYLVTRYWLKSERAGQSEPFLTSLSGFIDGISSNEAGLFWLTLISPRNTLLDALDSWPRFRKIITRLATAQQPDPIHALHILGLCNHAQIHLNLQQTEKLSYTEIWSVEEYGDHLYLGSLSEPAVGRFSLKGTRQKNELHKLGSGR